MFSLPVRKRRALPRIRLNLEELEQRALLSQVQPQPILDAVQSLNWSGYAAETNLSNPASDAVTSVSGSWTVPTVTGNTNAYSSVWVGIDGFSSTSNTVEQIGTEQDTSKSGPPTYYTWYEMYPAYPVLIPGVPISPGDQITASVSYNSGSNPFTLQITNDSTGASSGTIYASMPSGNTAERSSAEWIVEAPASAGRILPLANFDTVTFTGAQATISGTTGPISSWDNTAIDMVSHSGTIIALTSGLMDTPAPSSFTVTYEGSSSGHGHGHGHGPTHMLNVVPGQSDFQAPPGMILGVTVMPTIGIAPLQVGSPDALTTHQGVHSTHRGSLLVNQSLPDDLYH